MIGTISDILGIIAAAIAVGGAFYAFPEYRRHKALWAEKTKRLEDYLRAAKRKGRNNRKKGQHSTLHLVRHVGLTQDEILKISFESKNVDRVLSEDDKGRADVIFFEFTGTLDD
ncbi:MAG: hypothetical protein GY947_05715 [Rhodobacteraceae bacterium]|nr:hypothetical protein [Paracoccaceae bacterium]